MIVIGNVVDMELSSSPLSPEKEEEGLLCKVVVDKLVGVGESEFTCYTFNY